MCKACGHAHPKRDRFCRVWWCTCPEQRDEQSKGHVKVAMMLLLMLLSPGLLQAEEPPRTGLKLSLATYAVSVGADAWTTQSAFDRATTACLVHERNDAIAWVGEDRIAPTAVALGALTTWGLWKLGKKHPKTAIGLSLGMSALHLRAARGNREVCR